MTDPVRGRALVINIRNFYDGRDLVETRHGSECDFGNLMRSLPDLGFKIAGSGEDLTAQVSACVLL